MGKRRISCVLRRRIAMKTYAIDQQTAPGVWVYTGQSVERNRQSSAIKQAERLLPNRKLRVRLVSNKAKLGA